ncbi:MAG TPA: hypothetical protein DCS07_03180 [Bdellovibrionales bacterium]|nr:MAG: hypothetical protein A2Z97_07020 [Bdellovibrionales bacterium GWB1_52_6]OFZ05442.1 MAG: hypothetical protein A2X97_11230 [Bdellovibrionales bacterium GWA1_52_35]OFZ42305.1 MAG: hypothetical protein A2070_05490 [Bdellovibrionales bacterium GWC1_52_8]HAR41627.1 hypothetical protein [Bdellovibrionales bacterium]HCM39193.1 hypothetical protein [Bdellovibrionales bacterium]
MKHPNTLVLLFSIVLTLCSGSCTPNQSEKAAPRAQSKLLFNFDYTKVKEVVITRTGPEAREQFNARLQHFGPGAEHWRILSSSVPVLDSLANGIFLEHLLDSIRTLKITALGPSAPLETFGLHPPRFGIQWKAEDTDFEILFGDTQKNGSTYAMITKQGHGKGSAQVLLVRGAVQQLLLHLNSFEQLRFPNLSTLNIDEIDEFEISRNGKPVFYAQRQGSGWIDRKGQPKSAAQELLEKLNEQRITRYVDDQEQSRRVLPLFEKTSGYSIALHSRRAEVILLKARRDKYGVWSTVSSRPNAVFGISPEILKRLDLL